VAGSIGNACIGGVCTCAPHVIGDKCDTCAFYIDNNGTVFSPASDFGDNGCVACDSCSARLLSRIESKRNEVIAFTDTVSVMLYFLTRIAETDSSVESLQSRVSALGTELTLALLLVSSNFTNGLAADLIKAASDLQNATNSVNQLSEYSSLLFHFGPFVRQLIAALTSYTALQQQQWDNLASLVAETVANSMTELDAIRNATEVAHTGLFGATLALHEFSAQLNATLQQRTADAEVYSLEFSALTTEIKSQTEYASFFNEWFAIQGTIPAAKALVEQLQQVSGLLADAVAAKAAGEVQRRAASFSLRSLGLMISDNITSSTAEGNKMLNQTALLLAESMVEVNEALKQKVSVPLERLNLTCISLKDCVFVEILFVDIIGFCQSRPIVI
jgi:hypothetical protein